MRRTNYQNVFLVIPTIRNLSFLRDWKNQFNTCSLVVVEDHPTKEVATPKNGFKRIFHYSWEDIANDFGRDEWIFPRFNAGIRSYGFWKAYVLGADVVITLDDDCYPAEKNFVQKHLDNLQSRAPKKWEPTFPHPDHMYTRGFPYKNRGVYRTAVSHGLWSNKMDLDAKTQATLPPTYSCDTYPPIRQIIPFNYFFPMSSMNLAFTRDVIPLMYFLLMGKDKNGRPWGVDRYDDIWCGVIAKKILDHLGLAVVNGSPFVEHRKASSAKENLQKEKAGLALNEHVWKMVDRVVLTKKSVKSCYIEFSKNIIFPDTRYFNNVKKAMSLWINLFDE